jgi:ubiquinone biosynthesis protein Coq4
VITTTLIPEYYAAMEPLIDHEELARRIREDAARLPEFGTWLDERFSGHITPSDVRACVPGTLGHGVKRLFDQGFQLYFGRLGPAPSDFEYVRKRRAEVHDLEHIVTGFPGTALAGEMALYAANMVSTYAYFQPKVAKEVALVSSFLFSAWMLRTSLHFPDKMPAMCDAMEKGVTLGRALRRPLFMERWEDYLDWPLGALRAHFGIPEPGGFIGNWNWVEPATLTDREPAPGCGASPGPEPA